MSSTRQPKPLLSFHAVLSSQLDDSVSYHTLKKLLRALKSSPVLPYPSISRPSGDGDVNNAFDSQLSHPLTLSCSAVPPSPPSSLPTMPKLTTNIPFGQDNPDNDLENTERNHQQMLMSTSGSRLRRKRRHSRRPALASSSSIQKSNINVRLFVSTPDKQKVSRNEDEQNYVATTTNTAAIRDVDIDTSNTPLPSIISHIDLNSNSKAPSTVTAVEAGKHLNSLLHTMATQCNHVGVIQWSQFKHEVVQSQSQPGKYDRFCSFVDSIFSSDDPLATGPSDSSAPCVYYSDLFWQKTWNDYLAVIEVMS